MSNTRISVLNKAVQDAHLWLKEIGEEMGDPREQIAYQALRGTLFALRDRLPVPDALHLSAQLPLLVRGIYFEGYRAANKPEKLDRGGLLARVAEHLEDAGGAHPEKAVRAVLAVLESHIDPGEMQDVRRAMPKELRDLWPNRTMAL